MNKIIWEHPDIQFNEITSNFEEQSVYEDEKDDTEKFLEMMESEKKHAINTPFGIYEITDPFNPVKRCELWVGNANFQISHNVAKKINATKGVDSFRVLSRYSFIVGIGKAFNFADVRREIEEQLNCVKENIEIPDFIKPIVTELNDRFEKYAILVFPNGDYEIITGESEDYNSDLIKLSEMKEKVSGILIKR